MPKSRKRIIEGFLKTTRERGLPERYHNVGWIVRRAPARELRELFWTDGICLIRLQDEEHLPEPGVYIMGQRAGDLLEGTGSKFVGPSHWQNAHLLATELVGREWGFKQGDTLRKIPNLADKLHDIDRATTLGTGIRGQWELNREQMKTIGPPAKGKKRQQVTGELVYTSDGLFLPHSDDLHTIFKAWQPRGWMRFGTVNLKHWKSTYQMLTGLMGDSLFFLSLKHGSPYMYGGFPGLGEFAYMMQL